MSLIPTIKTEAGPFLKDARRQAKLIENRVQEKHPDFSFDEMMFAIDGCVVKDEEKVSNTITRRSFLSGLGAVGAYIGGTSLGAAGGLGVGKEFVFKELMEMEKKGMIKDYLRDSEVWKKIFWEKVTPYIISGAVIVPSLFFLMRKLGGDKLKEIINDSLPNSYIQRASEYPQVRKYVDMAVDCGVNPDLLIKLALFINVVEFEMRNKRPYKN